MKNTILVLFLFLAAQNLSAQMHQEVTYKISSNGKDVTDEPKLLLQYDEGIARLTSIVEPQKMRVMEEAAYFDYSNKKTYQTVKFNDGRRYTTIDSFITYPVPALTEETQIIQGYTCRKATVVIRSNHIDLWYTTDAGIKGTPGINFGPELGLVLKVVRNGNYEITADPSAPLRINDDPSFTLRLPEDWGEMVNLPEYKFRVTENNYQTYRVFDREKINFGDTIVNPEGEQENVTYRYSNGNVILKKIRLPENMYEKLVFAELTEQSNGDAYDRTGTVFIIPTNTKTTFLDALKNGIGVLPVYPSASLRSDRKKYHGIVSTENFNTPLELMRFFTPFGVGSYNQQVKVWGINWEDSAMYKQDVSDLLGALQGEVWIGVFIGCYDRGGHTVSLNLKFHPYDVNNIPVSGQKYWIQPVVNTVNIMETQGQEYGTVFLDDTLRVTVDVPAGLKNLNLRYISTGHGGWDGGDEFNPKMNEIFLDGKRIYNYIPWRSDCGTFRKFNPSSGNFPIGVSSSDFSRSGWCPGTSTNPVDIPIDIIGLKPGKHTLKIFIPMGKPEGTSFSAWNVSASFIGELK